MAAPQKQKPNVLELANTLAQEAQLTSQKAKLQNVSVLAEVGGWVLHQVDFGLHTGVNVARTVAQVIDVQGYAVQILQGGSDRVAAKLDAGDQGVYGPVYPGWGVRMRRKFKRLRLTAWENSGFPGNGTYTLPGSYCFGRYLIVAVAKQPDAEFLEPQAVGAGFEHYRYTSNQLYNVTTNTPALLNDGVSVRGAVGVRCGVITSNGSDTILTGTIVWWHDPTVGGFGGGVNWGETPVQQPLVTGRAICWLDELEVKCSEGRMFPELRSFTTSGGSGSPTIFYVAYGTGGDLSWGQMGQN